MMLKPMLASDWSEDKVRFPICAQPKIDGVRALNLTGRLTGRSLKEHANRFVTDFYSHPALIGFDGELAAEHHTHPSLCRLTTSALNRIEGTPYTIWWVFDYITERSVGLPYVERLSLALAQLNHIRANLPDLAARIRFVEGHMCHSKSELDDCDDFYLRAGYEGTILRDPHGAYKSGRSTVREGGLLRIKRFVEEEATVIRLVEGQTNANEATTNALGHTERSTHQANMIPNGMVGALECQDVTTGQSITVGAGCMPHEDRVKYWAQPSLLVGKTIKYKCFPKGVKDKPRFPTFQSLRAESDM